jgi:hypothetical protein
VVTPTPSVLAPVDSRTSVPADSRTSKPVNSRNS